MAFCLLKDGLLHCGRMPFANLSEVSENRKQKPAKCNKSKGLALKRRKQFRNSQLI